MRSGSQSRVKKKGKKEEEAMAKNKREENKDGDKRHGI